MRSPSSLAACAAVLLWAVVAQGAPAARASFEADPRAAGNPAASGVSPSDSDAAAKHVRRTACIKEARIRKLIGAQRDAFIKSCVDGR